MINNINLKSFTELSLLEKKIVLEWRNNFNIRKWMYNSNVISLDEHFAYIDRLSSSKDKVYFLVQNKNEDIGVIYLTNIDYPQKEANFGLYSKPNLKGVGSFLMSEIIKYAFNYLKIERLIAEVFNDNDKAISLYQKYNFKSFSKKIINNQEIIYMELKNENR
jgi:UDP-4-amino-4,6-dideoxy-N-acetyl-beta-L-altrosamine N-acetyltransferase